MDATFRTLLSNEFKEIVDFLSEIVPDRPEDQDSVLCFVKDFKEMMKLYSLKNFGAGTDTAGYGNSWRGPLGARMCIPEMHGKIMRLAAMGWGSEECPDAFWKSNPERMFTEARDIRMYAMFFMFLIRQELDVNEEALRIQEVNS